MKKSFGIIILTFIFIMLIRILGFTYGYFTSVINDNANEQSLFVDSKYLSVVYSDGTSKMNFSGDYLFPGDSAEKTFSVENTGTDDLIYNILIDNVINEFERTQDLSYELYIDNELIDNGAINNNEVQHLYYDRALAKGKTETVKFVFTYSETEEVQNMDMDKNLSFRFNISSKLKKSAESDSNLLTLVSNEKYLNNYRVYGNSLQTTTPSVDVPVEVESAGNLVTDETSEYFGKYKVSVKTNGKNIADPKQVQNFVDGMQALGGSHVNTNFITDTNGRQLLRLYAASGYGLENYSELRKIFKGIFKENTQYTITFDFYKSKDGTNNQTAMNLGVLYTDGTYATNNDIFAPYSSVANTVYSYTFTSKANKTISSINLNYNDGYTYIYMDTLQIEEGTTATEYEEYKENVTNIYLNEPLRKIGDGEDYIDFRKQKVYRSVKEVVFNGTEGFSDWIYNESSLGFIYWLGDAVSEHVVMTTHFDQCTTNLPDKKENAAKVKWNTLYIGTGDWASVTEFKSWVAEQYNNGKPLKLYYQIATPKEEPIKLPSILLNSDYNNIFVGTDIAPSKIYVED